VTKPEKSKEEIYQQFKSKKRRRRRLLKKLVQLQDKLQRYVDNPVYYVIGSPTYIKKQAEIAKVCFQLGSRRPVYKVKKSFQVVSIGYLQHKFKIQFFFPRHRRRQQMIRRIELRFMKRWHSRLLNRPWRWQYGVHPKRYLKNIYRRQVRKLYFLRRHRLLKKESLPLIPHRYLRRTYRRYQVRRLKFQTRQKKFYPGLTRYKLEKQRLRNELKDFSPLALKWTLTLENIDEAEVFKFNKKRPNQYWLPRIVLPKKNKPHVRPRLSTGQKSLLEVHQVIIKLFNSLSGQPFRRKLNFQRQFLFKFKKFQLHRLILELTNRVGFRMKKRGAQKIKVPRVLKKQQAYTNCRRWLKKAIQSRR